MSAAKKKTCGSTRREERPILRRASVAPPEPSCAATRRTAKETSLQFALSWDEPIEPPTKVHSYLDKIQIWLRVPLTDAEIRRLRRQSGKGKLHVFNKRCHFDPSYKQRLQVTQPTKYVLDFLSKRSGVLLNNVEVALDLVYRAACELQAAEDFFRRHLVKTHHRDQAAKFVRGTTFYSGPRQAKNVVAFYGDKPCRISGERHCFHIEWRIKGVRTLRRAGLQTLGDLFAASPRLFWSRRLKLYDFATERLGRAVNNRVNGTCRRTDLIVKAGRCEFSLDWRMGRVISSVHRTAQALLDEFTETRGVRRAAILLPTDAYLPTQNAFL